LVVRASQPAQVTGQGLPVDGTGKDARVTSILQERQKFGARSGIFFENTEQARCFHHGVLLFNTTHHHAEMFRLNDHPTPRGCSAFINASAICIVRFSWDLKPAREHVDDPRSLRQANDFCRWVCKRRVPYR